MTASSLAVKGSQEISDHAEQTKKKMASARTLTNLQVGAYKLGLRKNMDKESFMFWDALFELANKQDEYDGERFPDTLELRNKDIIDIGGAGSPDGLRRSRKKLVEFRIDGQALVEIEVGRNRGSQTTTTYKINYDVLLKAWNPMHKKIVKLPSRQEQEKPSVEVAVDPPHECGSPGNSHLYIEKEKKVPKPNIVVSTGNSQKHANTDQVSGTPFQIIKSEDPPIVKEIILYRVNRTIVEKAMDDMGEKWVWRIYREFNEHVNLANNMKSGPACLATRLKDYEESWRKTFNTPANSGELSANSWKEYLEPALVEEYQELVYKQYDYPKGHRGFVLSVLLEFKDRARISLTQALSILDVRGASRDDLIKWNSEVPQ